MALTRRRYTGSVGRPSGAVIETTCGGDRKVEVCDMFLTLRTPMAPTGFVAMTHDTYIGTFFFVSFQRKVET